MKIVVTNLSAQCVHYKTPIDMPENRIVKKNIAASNELLESRMRSLQEPKLFCLEAAGIINGIKFINDSAATSIEKVADSLITFEEPVVLIVQANSANQDFSILLDIAKSKVKSLIAVGEFSDDVHRSLERLNGFFVSASTWDEALDISLMLGKANDNVLFSPGSRANEPFENFKERGAYWNRLIDIRLNK